MHSSDPSPGQPPDLAEHTPLQVADVMTLTPHTLQATDTVAKGVRRLHACQVHSMPVVDAHGCFLGMFRVHGLIRGLLPGPAVWAHSGLDDLSFLREPLEIIHQRLDQVSSQPVVDHLDHSDDGNIRYCRPDTPLPELLLLLYKGHSSVPVLVVAGDDKHLVGIVSEWDILGRVGMKLLGPDGNEPPEPCPEPEDVRPVLGDCTDQAAKQGD